MDDQQPQQEQTPTPAPISNDGQTQITAQPPAEQLIAPAGRSNQADLDKKRGIAFMALGAFVFIMGIVTWPIGLALMIFAIILVSMGVFSYTKSKSIV